MSVDWTGANIGTQKRILTEVPSTQRILGIQFFVGSTTELIDFLLRSGGVLVVPAAPALVKLRYEDERYRRALTEADFAIADSGLMVLLWKLIGGENVRRISGLRYLKHLVENANFRVPRNALFVLPSEVAKQRTLTWSRGKNLPLDRDDCYVAPQYGPSAEDPALLRKLESRRPGHVVIAIGNGPQEKLGIFLRNNLSYRPAIHCIGAALGFLTGDQSAIPDWADRLYLGWLWRLVAQPRIFIPRLSRACQLPWLIWKHGENLPPLRGRV